jgi:hypothetical protein
MELLEETKLIQEFIPVYIMNNSSSIFASICPWIFKVLNGSSEFGYGLGNGLVPGE